MLEVLSQCERAHWANIYIIYTYTSFASTRLRAIVLYARANITYIAGRSIELVRAPIAKSQTATAGTHRQTAAASRPAARSLIIMHIFQLSMRKVCVKYEI